MLDLIGKPIHVPMVGERERVTSIFKGELHVLLRIPKAVERAPHSTMRV